MEVKAEGIFTDLVAFVDREVRITKVPSMPWESHRRTVAALDEFGLSAGLQRSRAWVDGCNQRGAQRPHLAVGARAKPLEGKRSN